MQPLFKYLMPLGIAVACTACGNSEGHDAQSQGEPIQYIDSANFNFDVKPGDDFFEFANGGWIKNTKMPGDKTRWGSFDELAERTDNSVKVLLESAKASSSDIQESMVAVFYKSGMDSAAINQKGIDAIKPQLDAIRNISNTEQLIAVMTNSEKHGVAKVFGLGVEPDDKNVSKLMIKLYQSGLGMPTKDYYTKTDSAARAIQEAYKAYISKILQFAGQDQAVAQVNAQAIYDLEHELAVASLSRVEMRDPQKLYNKFSVAEFSKQTPNLDWNTILDQFGAGSEDSLIVAMPSYHKALNTLLVAKSLDVWKSYMLYHTISDMSYYLTDDILATSFDFFRKTLRGQAEQEPRWKRVKNVINISIGENLGSLYVKKYFKPEAKEKMLTMVNNLQIAFEERIRALDWMSEATKAKALNKLNSFSKKIGYPDNWKDYSKLALTQDNYAQNVLNSFAFYFQSEIAKLGKPVNKNEWFMTPNTVNAYYNPSFNEIVFPAAILQFPFFDFEADDAINYGGIGAVIGHEMTHGFDDQGAQYAADGNLADWWTQEDKARFRAKADLVVNQYNDFVVLDTFKVNGALTLGENIADLGGVAIAYQAFKKTPQGQSTELIDGFTPDQRFFLSWAQIWRGIATRENALQMLTIDFHAPAKARANLPLANFTPFYEAFNVQPGDKMYLPEADRIAIW